MKKQLLTLLLTVCCLSAAADEPLKYLLIWANNGAKTTYALKDNPQVTFTDDALVVTKDGQETSFPMGSVQRFTYERIMLGDVNGDAKVDIVDVAKTINYLLTFTRSDFPEQAADIDKSGTVDSDDVTAMIKLVVNGQEADIPASSQQATGDAFYIYRNDNDFNAFFRDEVEKLEYSNYDADGNLHAEVESQLVYTADSVYNIPLTAIDSVGFVTPETIYKEDAVQLAGSLFDYLISVDSLTLTFDATMPSALTPKIGDKLVATELSEKLPFGFSGTVRLVQTVSAGIEVQCDRLELEDAVERFYGVAELVTYRSGGRSRRFLPRRAVVDEHIMPVNVNLPRIHLPLDLTGVIEPKKVYDIEGSARADITSDPVLTGRVTYVKDSRLGFSHYKIHAILDVETETNVEIAGGVLKGDFFKLLLDKDVPMPWGYPLYIALGPQFELSGELALGTTVYANFRHTSDITYYPTATAIAPGLSRLLNTESHSTEMNHFDIDWAYIAARAEAKLYVKGRLGLPFGKHEIGWVGAEFEVGAKCDAEIQADFEALSNAERGTGLYETLKDSKIEMMPYWGAVGKIGIANDNVEFKFLGRDDYSFWGKKWEWYLLPRFSDTEATVNLGSSIEVSANITDDCLIPYTVGFSLFDENGDRVGEPLWNEQKFWTLNSFTQPLKTTFTDIATDKEYKVYPTLRLFGFNVLASPSADVDMKFPVTITDFKVTKSHHEQGAFYNDGQYYDYRFDAATTVTLDDSEGVADWGYVYRDPNGQEKEISLRQYGTSYTDTHYAYFRNQAHSTACLYGYVKYSGSDETVYGEPHDYPLDYQGGETQITGTWTCVWYETPPNAKLLTMTLNENGTMSQTYYYANRDSNVTYASTYSYSNSTLIFYKGNGDIQNWSVDELTNNSLVITASNDGFKYHFKR